MTLKELAIKYGHVQKKAVDGDEFSAKHSCAAAVHGWPSYEYHYGPVDLEDTHYLEALEKAQSFEIHEPANYRNKTNKAQAQADHSRK
jgi:hypothetical protein